MSATNPFQPSKEQVDARVAVDPVIARLADKAVEINSKIAESELRIGAAKQRLNTYRQEVVEPARQQLLAALRGMRPLNGDLRREALHAHTWRRRKARLAARRCARVNALVKILEEKNLLAAQKELNMGFRRRRKRNLFKPEYTQQPWTSTSTPTETTTPDTSPATG